MIGVGRRLRLLHHATRWNERQSALINVEVAITRQKQSSHKNEQDQTKNPISSSSVAWYESIDVDESSKVRASSDGLSGAERQAFEPSVSTLPSRSIPRRLEPAKPLVILGILVVICRTCDGTGVVKPFKPACQMDPTRTVGHPADRWKEIGRAYLAGRQREGITYTPWPWPCRHPDASQCARGDIISVWKNVVEVARE